ncbi:hypothetical protein [Algihabitans albus]|uniref:hypothetical protein n=1 Tax=Algihabitans albus TaxID=2164067 RepID=UPI000E5D2B7B|nr:hypothetical protein [Algihabitans albus]
MIRFDAEGRVKRYFWPHLSLAAAALAGLAWDLLSGQGLWTGLIVGELLEPVTLLLAGVTGWWLLRHRYLLPALLAIGIIVGFGVTAVSFENMGRSAHFSLVLARVVAVVLTGYSLNALRLLLDPPTPRF